MKIYAIVREWKEIAHLWTKSPIIGGGFQIKDIKIEENSILASNIYYNTLNIFFPHNKTLLQVIVACSMESSSLLQQSLNHVKGRVPPGSYILNKTVTSCCFWQASLFV